MAQRRNAEPGLMDSRMALVNGLGGPRTTALLDRLDAVVAWEALVRPIPQAARVSAQSQGRPTGVMACGG